MSTWPAKAALILGLSACAVAADEDPPEPREVMDDYEPGDFGVTA